MTELELQILKAVQHYDYSSMPIREIPFEVDLHFANSAIESALRKLVKEGYLNETQLYFTLTDPGHKLLTAPQQCAAPDALQLEK